MYWVWSFLPMDAFLPHNGKNDQVRYIFEISPSSMFESAIWKECPKYWNFNRMHPKHDNKSNPLVVKIRPSQ